MSGCPAHSHSPSRPPLPLSLLLLVCTILTACSHIGHAQTRFSPASGYTVMNYVPTTIAAGLSARRLNDTEGESRRGTRGLQDSFKAAPSPSPSSSFSLLVHGPTTYHGGPVIKNINVVLVFWNAATLFQTELRAFYSALVTANPYYALLAQYRTYSPAQIIGPGVLGATYVASGLPASGTVTDAQIRTALAAMISSQAVPAPTSAGNNYYAIHLPPGVTVSSGGLSCRCVFVWEAIAHLCVCACVWT